MNTEDQHKIPVIEIFGPTIQGEGMVIGFQTFFVRFGGCDYKCTMCDSMHAVDKQSIAENASYMTPHQIGQELINRMGHCRMVTFSGGNPALWDLSELVEVLKEQKKSIAVETQGTYYKPWIKDCNIVTISPKGPGMGEKFIPAEFDGYIENLANHPGLNIKVVIFSNADLEFAVMIQERLPSHVPLYLSLGNPILPGPKQNDREFMDEHRHVLCEDYKQMAEEILSDQRLSRAIFLPQLHVLIWGNKQGV